MVDIAVKSGAAWVCASQGRHLADILLPVENEEELKQAEGDKMSWGNPVLLEQTEDGSPCILTLRCCSPDSHAAISRLLFISEARTIEVYSQSGEYCGTVRGERDDSIHKSSADRGPFFKMQLILEDPPSACDVKLLSLAGRNSVLVSRIIVGLQPLQPCPVRSTSINMQQVQTLVEEMGTNLSPGAKNLMEMVHFQQKNQTGSLGSLLPLLMGGGAMSALSHGGGPILGGVGNETQPMDLRPPHDAPPDQNGLNSNGSASPPDIPMPTVSSGNQVSSECGYPVSHAQLAEMMSHFLNTRGPGEQLQSPAPELLPMLQSVCGQVTQLRLDEATAAAERERTMRNGTWELDSAMERRLEEMEKRLKEHVDHRLDALEQKLEKVLLSTLPLLALNQGAVTGSAGGVAPATVPEQPTQTTAIH